jgi:hypothetical protein
MFIIKQAGYIFKKNVTIQSPAGDSGNRHKPQSGLPLFSVPVAQ